MFLLKKNSKGSISCTFYIFNQKFSIMAANKGKLYSPQIEYIWPI
jgi:hypothetical protein